jgi:hypothetical protein
VRDDALRVGGHPRAVPGQGLPYRRAETTKATRLVEDAFQWLGSGAAPPWSATGAIGTMLLGWGAKSKALERNAAGRAVTTVTGSRYCRHFLGGPS